MLRRVVGEQLRLSQQAALKTLKGAHWIGSTRNGSRSWRRRAMLSRKCWRGAVGAARAAGTISDRGGKLPMQLWMLIKEQLSDVDCCVHIELRNRRRRVSTRIGHCGVDRLRIPTATVSGLDHILNCLITLLAFD